MNFKVIDAIHDRDLLTGVKIAVFEHGLLIVAADFADYLDIEEGNNRKDYTVTPDFPPHLLKNVVELKAPTGAFAVTGFKVKYGEDWTVSELSILYKRLNLDRSGPSVGLGESPPVKVHGAMGKIHYMDVFPRKCKGGFIYGIDILYDGKFSLVGLDVGCVKISMDKPIPVHIKKPMQTSWEEYHKHGGEGTVPTSGGTYEEKMATQESPFPDAVITHHKTHTTKKIRDNTVLIYILMILVIISIVASVIALSTSSNKGKITSPTAANVY